MVVISLAILADHCFVNLISYFMEQVPRVNFLVDLILHHSEEFKGDSVCLFVIIFSFYLFSYIYSGNTCFNNISLTIFQWQNQNLVI